MVGVELAGKLAEKAAEKASRALTGDIYVSRWKTTKGKGKKKKVVDRELHINPLTAIVAVGAGALALGVGMFATQTTLKAKYGHKYAVIDRIAGQAGRAAYDGIDFEKAKTMTYQVFHPSIPAQGHYVTETKMSSSVVKVYTLREAYYNPVTQSMTNKSLVEEDWILAGKPDYINNSGLPYDQGYSYTAGMKDTSYTVQTWVEDSPGAPPYYTTEKALQYTGNALDPWKWMSPEPMPTKHYDAIQAIPEKWVCKRLDTRIADNRDYKYEGSSWEAAFFAAYPELKQPIGNNTYKGHDATGKVIDVNMGYYNAADGSIHVNIGEKRMLPTMGERTPTSLVDLG